MCIRDSSRGYKPFRYPWAYDFWKKQQQVHWMPEEVPLGEDCKDWAAKLNDKERNLLTQIFRFFTQADVEVQDCYHDKYGRVFKPTEIKMMLTAFSNMETIHIAAYSHSQDHSGHEPTRPRKMLLHRTELDRLAAKVAQERLSIVPLRIYFKGSKVKVEFALGKPKKTVDRRRDIAARDVARDTERELARAAKHR